MAPPYSGVAAAYKYFKDDATEYIRVTYPNWKPAEVTHTISGIWAGYKESGTLQQHYAGTVASRATTGPGLPTPNPIPKKPYTKANAEKAKKRGILRDGLPQAAPAAASHALANQTTDQVNQPSIHADAIRIPAPPAELYPWWPDRIWDPENEHELGLPENWSSLSVEQLKQYFKDSKFPKADDEDDVDLTQWYGARLLGNGATGIATLWVKVDENNIIQDVSYSRPGNKWFRSPPHEHCAYSYANDTTQNMAIKDTCSTIQDWRDPHNWLEKKPREVHFHQLIEQRRLEDSDSCYHLVGFKGYRILWTQTSYRMYLEFCSAGDMHDATRFEYREEKFKENKIQDRVLPEAFLWWVIKSMASACLVLSRGTQADDAIKDWLPIRHLDLGNIQNTFLAIVPEENSGGQSGTGDLDQVISGGSSSRARKRKKFDARLSENDEQPFKKPRLKIVPKVADFGLSAHTEPIDAAVKAKYPRNPLEIRLCGWDHRYASVRIVELPITQTTLSRVTVDLWTNTLKEQQPWKSVQSQPIDEMVKIDEKTDVWGIGSLVWQIMVHAPGVVSARTEDAIAEIQGKRKVKDFTRQSSQPMHVGGPRFECRKNPDLNMKGVAHYGAGVACNRKNFLNGAVFQGGPCYTTELKDLIKSCCNFEKSLRPTLLEVYRVATKNLQDYSEDEYTDYIQARLNIPRENVEFEIGNICPDRVMFDKTQVPSETEQDREENMQENGDETRMAEIHLGSEDREEGV